MQDEYENISFWEKKVIKKDGYYKMGMYVTKYTLSDGKTIYYSCLNPKVNFDKKVIEHF